jgi:hypothetical protein
MSNNLCSTSGLDRDKRLHLNTTCFVEDCVFEPTKQRDKL